MGVRPPSNDVDDEPDAIEFGIAALDARIEERNISFPIESADLDSAHGDILIDVNATGNQISLSDALADCEQRSFETRQELLNALHPIFEEKRAELSGSILGRLRAMVPF